MRTSAVCSMRRKNKPVQMARLQVCRQKNTPGECCRSVSQQGISGSSDNLRSRLTLLTVLST